MKGLLAEIARSYDFSRFTMEGFTHWLEQRRGRRIVFVSWSMPPTMFGAWLSSDGCDYVFYESDSLPIHQAHIQLHEMAHMLCGHSTLQVDSQQIPVLFGQLAADPAPREELLLRSVHSGEAEFEAETLAALIQEQALRDAGLQELSKAISSDGDFATHFGAFIETMRSYT